MSLRKPRHSAWASAALVVLLCLMSITVNAKSMALPEKGTEKAVTVDKTLNGKPFEYTISYLEKKPGFTIYRVTFPSPVKSPWENNNTVVGEYFVPDGIEEGQPARPAAICIHPLWTDNTLMRLMCSCVVRSGVPALMFRMPFYGERKLPGGFGQLIRDPIAFGEGMEQALKDISRAVDLLGSRPEIDEKLVGVGGVSMGAIISASAAGADPRINRAVLLLGGGDLRTIIGFAHETRHIREALAEMSAEDKKKADAVFERFDPLTHAPQLRKRAMAGKVLMGNAELDNVIPVECTKKLAEALGISDRVFWGKGLDHYTMIANLSKLMDTTAEFFAKDLPEGITPPPAPQPEFNPFASICALLYDIAAFAGPNPEEGKCSILDLSFSFTEKGAKKPKTGELMFARGSKGRFILKSNLPMLKIGEISIGNTEEYPWMAGKGGKLFKGVLEPVDVAHPLAYVGPQAFLPVMMINGILPVVAMNPESFRKYGDISEEKTADGTRIINLKVKKLTRGDIRITSNQQGNKPRKIEFDINGARGTVDVKRWLINSAEIPALFEPANGMESMDVRQEDVLRCFSSMFQFIMENIKR